MIFIFIFLLGSCVGSFLSVLVSRLDRKSGIIIGRSECPKCNGHLAWYDLIPIISIILLRFRCRKCKSRIALMYPAIEIVTGIVFVAIYIQFIQLGWFLFVINLAIASLLISLIFFDYLYFIIPDKIVVLILALTLFLNILSRKDDLLITFITGLIIAGVFAIMYLVSQGTWIGLGDIKLIFTIGFLLGYPNGFIAIVSSVWLAALVGLGLLIAKKATPKTAIPFGSFISIVSLIILIYQNEIQKIASRYFF